MTIAPNIYEKGKGASDISLKVGGRDADFSKTTHLVLNKSLIKKNESPLLNLFIVKLQDDCYLFEGQCFKIIDQTPERLLLQNIRFAS